jgi:uncharacterized membrane protein
MQLWAMIYLSGFAGLLMLFAWSHFQMLPLGGLFSQKATPWLLVVAILWPFAAILVVLLLALATLAEHFIKKDDERQKRRYAEAIDHISK